MSAITALCQDFVFITQNPVKNYTPRHMTTSGRQQKTTDASIVLIAWFTYKPY